MSRPFFGVLPAGTSARLVTAIELFQRRRRADGMPEADDLDQLRRALLGAYGGPAGTSFDGSLNPNDSELMNTAPRLLTYDETASRLSLSDRQVKRLVADNAIPVVRIGTAARIHSEDLEGYMNSLRSKVGQS